MQREHVVYAVARHSDDMPLALQCLDKLLLLVGAHTAEHAAFRRDALELFLSGHGAHVDAAVCAEHAGRLRDLADRHR